MDSTSAQAEIAAALGRVPNPPNEIARTIASVYAKGSAPGAGTFEAAPLPQPQKKKVEVDFATRAEYIARGSDKTEADLWEDSPIHFLWGDEHWRDAVALFRAVFKKGELVWAGEEWQTTSANVRTREEWCKQFERGFIPPQFCINPIKPGGGLSKDGKRSFRCDDAVSVYRHALAEIDDLPKEEQIQLWYGIGLQNVTSITFSGNKSLHVLLRVDAVDANEWETKVRGKVYKELIPLGCDPNCTNPGHTSRLAGARRSVRGPIQKLLYVREGLE